MIKKLFCILFIVLIAFILNIFVSIGMFTNFEKIGDHKCRLVMNKEPAVGPEDITKFSKEIMLISSDYKLELFEGDYPQ